MGFKPEKTIDFNIETNKIVYANTIRETNMNNILFLYKTGLNLHTAANYGYSLDENRPYHVFPNNRGRNVLLLNVISNTGILHYKIVNKF